ncbi:ATP-binding cassette domain-containing protein [Pararhizobium polonicum]|uniref:ATP-binding cassette domain-containing protein n=1 Tax=Pararhizobium polonicum TaxID=1612624 RepID=UPI00083B4CD8|nr:ATP-binding cassette domain-containing protein [Pararhizobium polonicum]
MSEPLVEVRGARKEYRLNPSLAARLVGRSSSNIVLDDVSLTIRRGETLGLVGESGSGKSTLARCIMQLEGLSGGEIRFNGQLLQGDALHGFRKRAQIVFQDPQSSINRAMRISDVLASPLELHMKQMNRGARRDRIVELLSLVGLPATTMDRWPHQLSGGQRQRIGIARALAVEPEFIILDEPTSALDVSIQAQVINLLADLQQRLSLTYLFISHDLNIVRYLSDRLAVMKQGQIVEVGDCETVFAAPQHPYTRQLLAATAP